MSWAIRPRSVRLRVEAKPEDLAEEGESLVSLPRDVRHTLQALVLPTFVIGLREGVEASLIVGIIAAFLNQQGAHRELRWMWAGVALAVALCVAVAIGLQILDDELPQKQQEGLETI